MRKIYFLLVVALYFNFIASSEAKLFSNQFIEFQLPEKWDCQLDGTEWVCQSTDEQKKRDAIIVLAAKIKKAGMDELPIYKAHLEKPQTYTSLSGESITSEPKYVKELDIAGKQWIDALHLQSEIPDFYTRYLATVESDLGILVTFSVRKDKYEDYAPDIDAMVTSLKAFRKPGTVNDQAGGTGGIDTNPAGNLFPAGGSGEAKMKPEKKADDSTAAVALLVVLVGAGGAFFVWKKKQKK